MIPVIGKINWYTFRESNSVISIVASHINWCRLIKERICSHRSKFFALRVYLILGRLCPTGKQTNRKSWILSPYENMARKDVGVPKHSYLYKFLIKVGMLLYPFIVSTHVGIDSIVAPITPYSEGHNTSLDPSILSNHDKSPATVSFTCVPCSSDLVSCADHIISKHKILWYPDSRIGTVFVKHILAVISINIWYAYFHEVPLLCTSPIKPTACNFSIGHHNVSFLSKEDPVIVPSRLETYWPYTFGIFHWTAKFNECNVTVHVSKVLEIFMFNNLYRSSTDSIGAKAIGCPEVKVNWAWPEVLLETDFKFWYTMGGCHYPLLRD